MAPNAWHRQSASAHGDGTSVTAHFAPVLTGSLVVACAWSTATGPGFPAFFTGLGASWGPNPEAGSVGIGQTDFHMAYAVVPAGGTDVTVSYPFTCRFVVLAVELVTTTTEFQAGFTNAVGPGTFDPYGGAGDVYADWLEVVGWHVEPFAVPNAVGNTHSFTDVNGQHRDDPDNTGSGPWISGYRIDAAATGSDWPTSGRRAMVEMAWAEAIADGPMSHVGTRADTAQGSGGVLRFGTIPTPPPPPAAPVEFPILARTRAMARLVPSIRKEF